MTERATERTKRVRRWSLDRERCLRCGLLRINVRHEPDPANAPEGPAYYAAIGDSLHEFVPSGEYEPQMEVNR